MPLPPGPLLVQLPSWLGDAVIASGTLASLARAFPGRAIDVLGNGVSLAVVRRHPAVREALAGGGDGGGLRGRWRAASALRRRPYAASLTLPPSWSAAVIARRAGARVRVGFAGAGRRLLLTRPVPRPPRGSVHLLEEYRRLVAALGHGAPAAAPEFHVDDAAVRSAIRLAGVGAYLAVAPGAVYGPAKRWPPAGFAEAARRVGRARAWRVVVVGAAADRAECAAVAAALGAEARDLCGRTDIARLAGVLAGARLVIANDSGPMHLAAAVGTPVVGVFGSSEPRWTAPLGGQAVTVASRPSCAPCFRRTCRIGTVCLTDLAADRVVEAAERLLAPPRRRALSTMSGDELLDSS